MDQGQKEALHQETRCDFFLCQESWFVANLVLHPCRGKREGHLIEEPWMPGEPPTGAERNGVLRVRTYPTACQGQPAAWVGSRWRWLLSWQMWGRHGPWADCWAHGTSCSPGAAPPPAALCHPSSSAPARALSLREDQERQLAFFF